MQILEGHITYKVVHEGSRKSLNSPEKIVSYLTDAFNRFPLQEQLLVIPMSSKLNPLARFPITLGVVNSVQITPREAFRPAILAGSCKLIMAHNHPCGDPTPSSADMTVTKQFQEAGDILNIKHVDHIIIGNEQHDPNSKGYYSFAEMGMI